MRLLRVLLAGVLVVVILAGVAVEVALRNQARIVGLVLARISAGTGLEIRPAHTGVRFGGHLNILLERPTVLYHGHQVATLDDLRAVVNYHAIIVGSGLPLHSLALDRPVVRMPASAAGVTPKGLPRPDPQAADNLLAALDAVEDVTYRVEVNDAQLRDVDLAPLVERFSVVAHKEHRRPGQWPWLITFDAHWAHAPLNGLALAGEVRLGVEPDRDGDLISAGRVSFSGLDLGGFNGPGGFKAAGVVAGAIRFAMRRDGEIGGLADAEFANLAVLGQPLTAPVKLGDCALHASYSADVARLRLSDVTISRGQTSVVEGGAEIDAPYDADRTLKFNLTGAAFALADVAASLRQVRALPGWLNDALAGVQSGQVKVTEASAAPSAPLRNWTAATLRDNLTLNATLGGAGFDPPAGSRLPPIRRLAAELAYAREKLAMTRGAGNLGQSSVTGVSADADLRDAPREIPYRIKGRGEIDAGELYAAAAPLLAELAPAVADRLQGAIGAAIFNGSAAGRMVAGKLSAPAEYALTVTPRRLQFKLRGAPTEIALSGGAINARPGELRIDRLIAAAAVPASGNVMLTGTIAPAAPVPRFSDFVVEAHELRAERWLPLIVDQKQLSARGAVGGRIVANSDPAKGGAPVVTGKLTMSAGELQFGFMRSPIAIDSATLALDGTGLDLNAPGAKLEGAPLDLKMRIADLAHPRIQIDANAQAIDFEVLKFIRMPWSPKTEVTVFPVPVGGHLKANRAAFGKLDLTNVTTDFERGGGRWRVYNFTTEALGGRARLKISGLSTADNWIHIVGRGAAMNAARIFMLTGNRNPPIAGTIGATIDLWANTDLDFFSSMRGKIGFEATNGTLNRFALVSRILSFIDLKNWLTARLPDPAVAGIPFTKLSCDAAGANGIFETNNFKLRGPVMEIAASGAVNVGNGTMNMEFAMIPFDTFNWLVSHIPIIGWNLAAGSKGLVAAYFRVYGPVSDPTVVPQPITSVAEFLAKTLSMPINIIVPNTIKP